MHLREASSFAEYQIAIHTGTQRTPGDIDAAADFFRQFVERDIPLFNVASHVYSSHASLPLKPATPTMERVTEGQGRERAQSEPRRGFNTGNDVSGIYRYERRGIPTNGSEISLKSLPHKFKSGTFKGAANASGRVDNNADSAIGINNPQFFHLNITPARRRRVSSITEVDETAKERPGETESQMTISKNASRDQARLTSVEASAKELPCEADNQTAVSKPTPTDQVKLKKIVSDIFSRMSPTDPDAMSRLQENVLEKLLHRGIDSTSLKKILEKLQRADNRVALIMGALSSIGFIGGEHAWKLAAPALKTMLPPVIIPFLPGATTAIVDRMASWIFGRVNPGYHCACPDPQKLTDVIGESLIKHQRPLMLELSRQATALSMPYTLRNVIVVLCSTIAAHFGNPELVKTLVNNVGGVFAGAKVQCLRNENDKLDGLNDPAYFFGRIDLDDQLDELIFPQPVSCNSVTNAAYRLAANLPGTIFDSLRHLGAFPSGLEIAILAPAFAVNAWVEATVEEQYSDASPPAVTLATYSSSMIFLFGLYNLLGGVMAGAGRFVENFAAKQPCPDAPATSRTSRLGSGNKPPRY